MHGGIECLTGCCDVFSTALGRAKDVFLKGQALFFPTRCHIRNSTIHTILIYFLMHFFHKIKTRYIQWPTLWPTVNKLMNHLDFHFTQTRFLLQKYVRLNMAAKTV